MTSFEKVRKVYPNAEVEAQRRFEENADGKVAYRVTVRVPGGRRSTGWHWHYDGAWDEAAEWDGVK
jgi:hypothetical protein